MVIVISSTLQRFGDFIKSIWSNEEMNTSFMCFQQNLIKHGSYVLYFLTKSSELWAIIDSFSQQDKCVG